MKHRYNPEYRLVGLKAAGARLPPYCRLISEYFGGRVRLLYLFPGVHDCARASGTKSRIVVHIDVLDVAVLAAVDEHAASDNSAIRVNERGLVRTKVCRGNHRSGKRANCRVCMCLSISLCDECTVPLSSVRSCIRGADLRRGSIRLRTRIVDGRLAGGRRAASSIGSRG